MCNIRNMNLIAYREKCSFTSKKLFSRVHDLWNFDRGKVFFVKIIVRFDNGLQKSPF